MVFAEAAVNDEEGAGGGNGSAGMSGYGDESSLRVVISVLCRGIV